MFPSLSQCINIQCVFVSEDIPCEHCAERNLACVKVLGPKKTGTRDLIHSEFEGGKSVIASPLSLIVDSDLSDRELFYLRRMHSTYQNDFEGYHSIILQNLWSVYGLVFRDKALLYGVLAWQMWFPKPYEQKLALPPSQRVDFHTFKSGFHNHLMRALKRHEVSECHFFALYFAIDCFVRRRESPITEMRVYQRILLEVFKRFARRGGEHGQERHVPLQYLHPFVLSWLRMRDVTAIFDSGWVAPDPELAYVLYNVDEEFLPSSMVDERLVLKRLRSSKDWETVSWFEWDGSIFQDPGLHSSSPSRFLAYL